MAARAAGLAGAKVLMVDKKMSIGYPAHCAGGAGGLWLYAKRLNLEIDPRVIAQEIKRFVVYSPSGRATPELAAQCTNVNRELFDRYLVKEAIRAGADIMLDTRVIGLIKEDNVVKGVIARSEGSVIRIKAKVVIGADKGSIVARSAGLGEPGEPVLFHGYEFCGVEGQDPEVFYTYFGNSFAPGGHAVQAPRGKDTAYLGTGAAPHFFKEGQTLRGLFKELLKHPVVSNFFKKAKPIAIQGGPCWVGGPMEKTVGDGVILAGDAAGQLWAATAGGITPAMTCGNFAGEVAAKAALEGDVSERRLKEYEERWRTTIGKSLFDQLKAKELLHRIVSSDALIERAVQEIGLEFVGLYVYGTEDYRQPVEEWLKGKI
jgi:digeranylgeranylglycerophospholipid reductase